jgi:hypothetical protein
LNPIKLGKRSTYNDAKKRQEMSVEVKNPAESRTQKETLKVGSVTGVILRGGGVFGWTSQDVDTAKFPSSLFMLKTESMPIKSKGDLKQLLSVKAKEILNQKDSPSACFNRDHIAQLRGITEGAVEEFTIEDALKGILEFDESSEFEFHARAFGGGPYRAALTFDMLVKKCVPWYRRMFSRKITIDEMWGEKQLEYSTKNKSCFVGIEYRGDGKKHYIRVTVQDRSPSETYFRAAA